jgi:hypothetical protein
MAGGWLWLVAAASLLSLFACRFAVVFAVAVVVRLLLRRLVAVARRSLRSMTALAFARLSLVVARPLAFAVRLSLVVLYDANGDRRLGRSLVGDRSQV